MDRYAWWIGILAGLAATATGVVTLLVFGMLGNAFPWFLAFPAEGFGWLDIRERSRGTPDPQQFVEPSLPWSGDHP
jgi:hypothetical protein